MNYLIQAFRHVRPHLRLRRREGGKYSAPYRVLAVLTLLLASVLQAQAQHVIPRGVMSSGGAYMQGTGHNVHGTLSQTTIGLIGKANRSAGIGFWYSAAQLNKFVDGGIVVLLPKVEDYANKIISIPMILAKQSQLRANGAKTFNAIISVRRSLLYPIDADFSSDNERHTIMVHGMFGDTTDGTVLAYLKFKTLLGDAESTPLVIESFLCPEVPNLAVVKQDGEFRTLGICKEGDDTRLVTKSTRAILYAHPNPARTTTTIDFTTSEAGRIRLVITDLLGKEVAVVVDRDLQIAKYEEVFDVSMLPSGRYYLTMVTPSEVLTTTLEVSK